MKQPHDLVQTTLRMPRQTLALLKHRAIDNRRSLSGEILTLIDCVLTKENASEGRSSEALDQ
ncbi:Arc family DNA-binding protein [Kerstersia gyiorum]|uniref:Arc family DNA-binding protein n=1 Tax=Kerstersia gyiorum TaxID=206506 RepID=UPI0039E91A4D